MSSTPTTSSTDNEASLSTIRSTLDLFGHDFVRGIIEVVGGKGGRVAYDVVASEVTFAAHSPTFEDNVDGVVVLKLFMDEFRDLMEGMNVRFDDESNEFFSVS